MERIQYTVRNVPPAVDRALRRKASSLDVSLNHVLLAALEREVDAGSSSGLLHHDLDHLAGKWEEDPEFDAAIAAADQIDPELWR